MDGWCEEEAMDVDSGKRSLESDDERGGNDEGGGQAIPLSKKSKAAPISSSSGTHPHPHPHPQHSNNPSNSSVPSSPLTFQRHLQLRHHCLFASSAYKT